jgi:preprotein translocase subunit SecE
VLGVRIPPGLPNFSANPGLTRVISRAKEFLANVKSELKKVTWPTRKDTYASTVVVLLLVFFVAVFLWVVDSALSMMIRGLLS